MFWLLIKNSSLKNNTTSYFSHYTTLATPLILVPFIKMVEVVSKVIRPITLGVRLAVNLITGHLLLSLFSNFHCSQIFLLDGFFFFFFIFGVTLFLYESCVSIIQALVYNLMLFQYLDEHTK
jgi:F-type H+-transporting ATPase subunit a